MVKKLLLIASAILTVSTTAAFASVGPYFGVSGGADDSDWHTGNSFSITDVTAVGPESFITNSSRNLGGHGFLGTVFLGYGALVCSNIYLGGEIFGNIVTTSLNNQTSFTSSDPTFGTSSLSISEKLRTKYGYGISFMPGVVFNNSTIGYARIGAIRTHFNYSLSITGIADDVPFTAFSSSYNNANGGQLGLGIQTSIAPNFDVRGEYIYTAYQAYSTMGVRIIPRDNQVNIGLVYKFC